MRGRGWVKFWTVVLFAELIFATGFLIGDLIYFPKVNRHIAEEIVQVANDWGYVLKYMLTQVWLPLIILLGGFAWAVRAFCCYTDKHFQANRYGKIRTGEILFLIVLFTFLGIRGHIGRGKSIGVADVYNYASSPAGAALTLNGAFTAYQVGRKGAMEISNTFPAEKALELTQKRFVAADETVPDENYPLMRQAQPEKNPLAKGYNVMIVLLEGWHPYYVDGLSGQAFGATPVFDDILKNGVNFTNAYAAGLRSIFGFAAVLRVCRLYRGCLCLAMGLN